MVDTLLLKVPRAGESCSYLYIIKDKTIFSDMNKDSFLILYNYVYIIWQWLKVH